MKKLILLLLALIFPLSAFAQYDEYTMKVETDSVIYNEDSKILEIPFYFEKDNWERLNPNLLLHTSCGSDYNWFDDSSSSSNYVQFDWKKVKDGLLYSIFNFSESSIPWGHKLILRFTNFLGCDFPQWSIKYENEQDYFTWTIPNDKNSIFGCTNPSSPNYDPYATDDDGTCVQKIEGCTDSTATNYNPRANIHVENMCQYAPEWPSEITGFFENSPTVQIWATTWTIKIKTNVENTFLDISKVQTWEHFRVTEYTTEWKDIIITMKQFNDQRLELEKCTNYEITIPRDAITAQVQKRTGMETIKNHNAITGNFIVENCPQNSNPPTDPDDQNSQTGAISTIKDNGFYLSIFDIDENWKTYFNITNLVFFLGFVSVTMMIFYWFFNSIKKIFLWKKR